VLDTACEAAAHRRRSFLSAWWRAEGLLAVWTLCFQASQATAPPSVPLPPESRIGLELPLWGRRVSHTLSWEGFSSTRCGAQMNPPGTVDIPDPAKVLAQQSRPPLSDRFRSAQALLWALSLWWALLPLVDVCSLPKFGWLFIIAFPPVRRDPGKLHHLHSLLLLGYRSPFLDTPGPRYFIAGSNLEQSFLFTSTYSSTPILKKPGCFTVSSGTHTTQNTYFTPDPPNTHRTSCTFGPLVLTIDQLQFIPLLVSPSRR
jgi:hypothetical protein